MKEFIKKHYRKIAVTLVALSALATAVNKDLIKEQIKEKTEISQSYYIPEILSVQTVQDKVKKAEKYLKKGHHRRYRKEMKKAVEAAEKYLSIVESENPRDPKKVKEAERLLKKIKEVERELEKLRASMLGLDGDLPLN